jgi:hypothetical protein
VLAPLSELIDNQLGGMTESGKSVGDLKSVKLSILKNFMSDMRLFDIGCVKYWMWMLTSVLVFLIAEIVFVWNNTKDGALWNVVKANNIAIGNFYFTKHVLDNFKFYSTLLLIFVVIFLLYLNNFKNRNELIKKNTRFEWLSTSTTISILIIALSILGLNFYLVLTSGWNASPFLPGLLGIAGIISGLPRENNMYTLILSFLCIGIGLFCILFSSPQPSLWVDNGLSTIINAFSFGIAVLISILLRSISSTKVKAL